MGHTSSRNKGSNKCANNENPNQERVVSWPPNAILITPLGYLRDANGNNYGRDIGRSTELSDGTVLIQLGDTFSNDHEGNFIGSSTNTCAVTANLECPTISSYKLYEGEEEAHELIKLMRMQGEDPTPNHQYSLRAFGGICETVNSWGVIRGFTYYVKRFHDKNNGTDAYVYTGIAEVNYDHLNRGRCLWSTRIIQPTGDMALFKIREPRLGTFCSLVDNGYIYVYGHKAFRDWDVCLGRVPLHHAVDRKYYTFWDGQKFQADIEQCMPVLTNMQHGQIFPTEMFGRTSIYKWAFIGCLHNGDSKVVFGRAPTPAGPFSCYHIMDANPLISLPTGGFTYCMYPHTWAFENEVDDLLITWSEGSLAGNVVAARVRLQTEKTDKSRIE